MPSNEDVFWESFLERVTAHQRIAEEDVQDIGKASLWMVLVKVTLIFEAHVCNDFLLSLDMRSG